MKKCKWTLSPGIFVQLAFLMLLAGCQGRSNHADVDQPYLDAAVQAADGLIAQSDDGGGARIPTRFTDGSIASSLGGGAAGHALYFAELFAATGDSTYLRSAQGASWTAIEVISTEPPSFGLYRGLAGVAAAVSEVAEIASDRELRDEARRLFIRLAEVRDTTRVEGGWGDVHDVMVGRAGIGLALLAGYRTFEDPNLLEAAILAGDDLLAVARSTAGGGLRWMRSAARELDLPNFSHGTAGVGFLLARLAEETGESRFLTAALRAATYLDQIADTSGGLFLIPYGVPNDGYSTTYDIGWAHGPAGASRLHYTLWKLTGDDTMRDRVDASARTIIASGVPRVSNDTSRWAGPFGIDQRFGTSGAAMFLADWNQETGNPEYAEAAEEIAADILAKATRSEQGLHWEVPLYGFQGEGEAVFTGYFYGSAGLGLALLRQHYLTTGGIPRVRLPDDPNRSTGSKF